MQNQIKALREARGLSLEALARRAGTTNQQISNLELGKRRLTVEWLLRLATVLECDPLELIGQHSVLPVSTRERALIAVFRDLTAAQQDAFLALAATIPQPPLNERKSA
jgi:transcriptional regulator with XRE-family HTH domain